MSDTLVRFARPTRACGCDESKALYKTAEALAETGLKLEAQNGRLLEDLVNCQRQLARMTVLRDEAEERRRELIKARGGR